MEDFLGYCRQRLADDPHLWSTTFLDEVVELGFAGSYQAFTASVRRRELRPFCQACAANKHKDRSVIDHPAGQEASGTGWSCPTRRSIAGSVTRRICCSGCCRIRAGGVHGWPRPRTNRT